MAKLGWAKLGWAGLSNRDLDGIFRPVQLLLSTQRFMEAAWEKQL